jgi:hypothetical protein
LVFWQEHVEPTDSLRLRSSLGCGVKHIPTRGIGCPLSDLKENRRLFYHFISDLKIFWGSPRALDKIFWQSDTGPVDFQVLIDKTNIQGYIFSRIFLIRSQVSQKNQRLNPISIR